jgi:TolB-like protein/Tfp pilus assembly protein PilF
LILKFGHFELDPPAYELRRRGRPVRLERLPMELLLLLVERRGALVTREEIAARLWGANVFHDVDNGVHTAVRKVRRALNTSRNDGPAFVRTVSGKGYRFVAPVTTSGSEPEALRPDISLAVLPFENLTGEPDQDYLSDGLTEETIAAMGNLAADRLKVIARTSVMRYKGTTKSAREIGAELGADYLVESTVRRDELRICVRARLVRARDHVQLWSGKFDRDRRSALKLQEDLARTIATHVHAGVAPETAAAHSRHATTDPDAYDLYLRGRYYWNQVRSTSLWRAMECFESTISKDPSFALAWSGLADTFSILPVTSDADPAELWSKARHAADEALRLQCAAAESWTSSGAVSFWLDWDWTRAERDLRRAVQLNPNYVPGQRFLAHVLSNLGRHPEALSVMENARRLDPLSPALCAVSGQLYFQAGQFHHAADQARRALALHSDLWLGHLILGKVHERTQKTAAALKEFDTAFQLSEGNTEALSLKGYTLAVMGRRTEAGQVLRTLLETAHTRFVPPYNVALLFAGLNDADHAYQWLEKARLHRDVHMVFLTVEPKWDPFRNQPRFLSLLNDCALPVLDGRPPGREPAPRGARSPSNRS